MSRDVLYDRLRGYNVFSRRYFHPLVCDYACYRNVAVRDPLTVARGVASRILTLPIYDSLEASDVEKICAIIISLQKSSEDEKPAIIRRKALAESRYAAGS